MSVRQVYEFHVMISSEAMNVLVANPSDYGKALASKNYSQCQGSQIGKWMVLTFLTPFPSAASLLTRTYASATRRFRPPAQVVIRSATPQLSKKVSSLTPL